jgi:membrane protein
MADNALTYSAAFSYSILLALAPMLIIAVGVMGLLYGRGTTDTLVDQAREQLGAPVADTFETVLESTSGVPGANAAAIVIGGALLLFSAAGAFRALRTALNAMWNVESVPTGRDWGRIRRKVLGQLLMLGLVLGLALLVLALIAAGSAWSALSEEVFGGLPGAEVILRAGDFLVSLALLTGVFALVFWAVPLAEARRRDLLTAGALTAVLFTIGKLGLGLYLSNSSTGSAYGAAGTLVLFLVWVYYSSAIVFFGAEFGQAWARIHDREIQPRTGARFVAKVALESDQQVGQTIEVAGEAPPKEEGERRPAEEQPIGGPAAEHVETKVDEALTDAREENIPQRSSRHRAVGGEGRASSAAGEERASAVGGKERASAVGGAERASADDERNAA